MVKGGETIGGDIFKSEVAEKDHGTFEPRGKMANTVILLDKKEKLINELLEEREKLVQQINQILTEQESRKQQIEARRKASVALSPDTTRNPVPGTALVTPADTTPEDVLVDVPLDIPEDTTAGTPEAAPEDTPEAAPEDTPEAAPEDTPATDDEAQEIDDETVSQVVEKAINLAGEDQPSPEAIKEAIEESKKSKSFKRKVAAFGIGALTLIISFLSIVPNITKGGEGNKTPQSNPKQTEASAIPGQTDKGEKSIDKNENAPFDYESVSGIIDGYGEKGMFLSPNKGGQYDFAAAQEVAKVCKNDKNEMLKYVARLQVGNLASYIAGMPEELQPEGFKGLSILEAEEKIESLSPDKYDALFKDYGLKIEDSLTREVVLEGEYENVYMKIIDPSKPVTHENVELVTCVTEEHGTKAIERYWLDDEGNEIGSIIIKIECDEDGNVVGGCTQLVKKKGTTTIFERLKIIDGEPTKPKEIIKQKNEKKLVKIDKKMNKETEDNIKTGEFRDYVSPGVKKEDKTTEPVIKQETAVQNDDSKPAEKVTTELPDNNYGTNQGGANSDGYQPVDDKAEDVSPTYILPEDSSPKEIYDYVGAIMDDLDRMDAEREQQKLQQQLQEQLRQQPQQEQQQ